MSKIYFFYFTHLFLQNTYISLSIVHIYSKKLFISLPTQPLTHTHNPHRYHTRITQPTGRKLEKQTQQHNPHNPPEIDASPWATRSTPPVTMARTRNKIDASKGKRWRWRWRWQWWETFNPKPTNQAHSTRKQRETKEERAIGGGGNRRKLEEERLIRWEKERVVHLREKGSWELGTERREKKLLKNYIHMLQYPCIFVRVL